MVANKIMFNSSFALRTVNINNNKRNSITIIIIKLSNDKKNSTIVKCEIKALMAEER